MAASKPITVVATLGGQPQVVTFALDALLQDYTIKEMIVLYLASSDERMVRALGKLAAEFKGNHYRGYSIPFQALPIGAGHQPLADIYDESDADAVFQFVYSLIVQLKAEGRMLHVCISGGRRILGLLTLSAAMLHFGHQDRLWHMYTPPEWQAEAHDGALMHLPADSGFQMIQVPMMAWGRYLPGLRDFVHPIADGDVLARPRRLLDAVERARCRAVVERLTPRQQDVLRLLAGGLHPRAAAEALSIEPSTVDSHKTVILAECRNEWALPDEVWLDYRFLQERFEMYFEREGL
ncbi:MAG: LuxR C-terminal-related transcriptional regulator [Candidatus Promineofilum sp.]|nr:LuxR C-terminal-related transcriptional regulator [Promineifilum sp.]